MRKFSKLVVLCLTLVMALFLASCKEKIELSFENETMTMIVGDTKTLVPVANKEGLTYEWTSDKTAVVTVDAGLVTAVSAGTAKVTVKVKDKDVSATITITVNPVVVSFTEKTMTIAIDQSVTLTPTVVPAQTMTYTWTTSDASVATVTNGVVKGIKVGTATVTASGKGGSASITINVVLPNPTQVTITGASASAKVGATMQLGATILPAKASQAVTWKSSDTKLATVSASGLVTFVGVGKVTITATSVALDSQKASVTIDVGAPDPTKVAITGASTTAKVGDKMQLSATVLPATALQTVAWKSSDTTLATVTPAGLVTFLGMGSVTITATSTVLNTLKATVTIEVGAPDPASIAVTGTDGKDRVIIGETLQMLAVVSPELANQGVRWSTSDETIATIDENGLLNALKVGEITVIATSTVLETVSGQVTINVVLPEPVGIEVKGDESVLQVAETVQLTTVIQPLHASQEVIYSSSDEAIATVSESGLVTGVSAGTAAIIVKSKALETVLMTYTVKIVAKIENPDYSHILVDANLEAERYSTLTFDGVDYIVGINAFKSLAQGFGKIVEGSTVMILAGTYEEAAAVNFNNVTILGPNALINPVTDLESRLPEAILTKKLTLGAVQNIVIKGIELTAQGQIYSAKNLKNITVENVYTVYSSVEAAQGVIYFGISDDSLKNEDLLFKNNSLNDTRKQGYRGIRVNNAYNITIEGNYFYGFFDTIRLEGTGNSGWTQPGTGCGAAGVVLIQNNTFRMNIQYPILLGRYSATKVDILNNDIGVDPDHSGVYGLTNIINFAPEAGAPKTVVNIKYNNFLHNTAWHDVRFKTGTATADQLEINVNFNKFNEGVCIDPTDGPCNYIDNGGTSASKNNIINGQFNYFAVKPIEDEFRGLNDKGFAPYYLTLEEYNDALTAYFVDPSLVGKAGGDAVVVQGLNLVFGERAFATLASALEAVPAKATIIVLPGTYSEKITIDKGVTLKTLNANVNPTEDATAFLAASPTATISNEVWYIKDDANTSVNDLTIKGFTFTGGARISEYGASGNQYRFLYENNYAFDTTAPTLAWKQDAYSSYGVGTEADTAKVPGFISLAPNGLWMYNVVFRNNKFVNVKDTNIYLMCLQGVTIEGNEFSGGDRDAIRLEYGSQGGIFNIKNNTFENMNYNGIYIRSYSGSIYAPDFVANIYYNTFKNVGLAGATETPTHTRIGAIATRGYGEKMNATFNIRYNAFENCTNYISLRANVSNVEKWNAGTKKWMATIEYNSFIDADGVTKYFQNLLNAGDTAATNVDDVYINYNFYGTDANTKAITTLEQFDHHKVAASNLVVYNTLAELEAGRATSLIPASVVVTGKAELKGGEVANFSATVLPNTAPQDVVWSTSNASIAIVDENGKVTGLKPGTAKIKATAKDLDTVFGEFDVTVEGVLTASFLVDAETATMEELAKVTYGGKDYYVGVNAFDTLAKAMAVADTGTTIYVNKGTYLDTDAITINKDNLSLLGPNANIDGVIGARGDEAIINSKITLASGVKNVVINGFYFNHKPGTCVVTGEAAGLIDGFKFINNIVDGYGGDGSSGFIVFKQASAEAKIMNFTISHNKFFSFGSDRIVRMAYVENLIFTNNLLLDASTDGLRLHDNAGGIMGTLQIVGNTFNNVGQFAVFIGTSACTSIVITDNNFVSNGHVYDGAALSLRKTGVDAAGTTILIANNFFDRSSDYDIRIDHSAVEADNLVITVSGNVFKTAPKRFYYYNNISDPVPAVKTNFTGNIIYAADGVTVADPATVADKIKNATVADANPALDLFFSEYGEGSSNNKWLEIYNPTNAAIDLSGYKVELYTNGNTNVQNSLTFQAGTMLAAGDVLLIVNDKIEASQKLPGAIESNVTYFNGNDALVLKKGDVVIDIIGLVGNDPGTNWAVGVGATSEYTLVRKSSYAGLPLTVFAPEQWDVYPQNYFGNMDSHAYLPAYVAPAS